MAHLARAELVTWITPNSGSPRAWASAPSCGSGTRSQPTLPRSTGSTETRRSTNHRFVAQMVRGNKRDVPVLPDRQPPFHPRENDGSALMAGSHMGPFGSMSPHAAPCSAREARGEAGLIDRPSAGLRAAARRAAAAVCSRCAACSTRVASPTPVLEGQLAARRAHPGGKCPWPGLLQRWNALASHGPRAWTEFARARGLCGSAQRGVDLVVC